MSLLTVLADLYGRPDEFLDRLRSELLLHKKTVYQLWAATHVKCAATEIVGCVASARAPMVFTGQECISIFRVLVHHHSRLA
jgi:hypothetical protein